MSDFVRGFDTLSSKFHAYSFDKNSFRVIQIYLPDRYEKQNQTELKLYMGYHMVLLWSSTI